MPCAQGPLADRADLLGRVDGAGRVGRRAEQQHLGLRGARRLELLDGDEVALVLAGEDLDRGAAGELDRLGVGRPVRRRQQDLVAGVEQGGEGVVDRLLAAVGDQHLLGRHLVAAVAGRLGHDGLLQVREAAGGGVTVVRRVVARGDGGSDDVVGGGEVGLTGAEADDRPSLGLERLGPGVDRQGGRLGDGADAPGDPSRCRGGCGVAGGGGRSHDSDPPRPARYAAPVRPQGGHPSRCARPGSPVTRRVTYARALGG